MSARRLTHADVICDNCPRVASRMITTGPRVGRRFLCNECGESGAAIHCIGKRANDALRADRLEDAVLTMRRQNVRHGLLSPQKFAALCRWDR